MRLFLLALNGAEAGPFTKKQLRAMWLTGAVTVATDWREPHNKEWYDGKSLPALLEGEPVSDRVSEASPSVQRRIDLRGATAYPFARRLLWALKILLLLVAVAAWLLALGAPEHGRDDYVLPVAVSISAAAYWALALVGQALLDVADCQLKRP
jgi:hypothetical protein